MEGMSWNALRSASTSKDQPTAVLSPCKALYGCFLFSLVFVSLSGVSFLYPIAPFRPFAKRALNLYPHLLPPPRIDAVMIVKPHTDKCDLSKGKWVADPRGPLYNATSCLTLPDSKNCFKYGRKDVDFLNWRWKPDECDLPRFDPSVFLKLVRGKKLAFVGDSLARNQMESLLCLLSQAERPLDVYRDTEEGRFRTWNFPSSNFTLMAMWTQYLVKQEERVINGSNSGTYNLHVDEINDAWASKLRGLDYVVISVGHWLFKENCLYNKSEKIGCVVYSGGPTVRVEDVLRMVYRTALSYIDKCEECGDVLTVLRTFSPEHFEYGEWNSGGICNRTRPYSEGQRKKGGEYDMELRRIQIEEVERVRRRGRGRGKRFTSLDVTIAMLERPDGHPDVHWPGNAKGSSDCAHWCMPGPVDAWNDLLMAVLKGY